VLLRFQADLKVGLYVHLLRFQADLKVGLYSIYY
jgi:hypothetical protein